MRLEQRVDRRPFLTSATEGTHVTLRAAGAWTSRNAAQIDEELQRIAQDVAPQATVTLDMREVDEFDTYGAWFVERLRRTRTSVGSAVSVTGLAERFHGLADAVHKAEWSPAAAPAKLNPAVATLDTFGHFTVDTWHGLRELVTMLGAVGHAAAATILRPSTFRLTSTVHQIDRVGWQAVPIIALITFLIGGIIAQQGFFHFRKFGADQYVVDMVGILVLREIGVLIVAIMVAGRSGSSYTAELGSMKMREEIDALRTMGLDPIRVLILPRIAALIISLPALTFIGSMAALLGGGFIAWTYGDMNPEIFIARLREAISITHFKVGMIKAPFMALTIGVVACTEGLKVKGSAESLGKQTTASVVKSIFLVIVLDGLFAVYFAGMGM